VGDLSVSTNKIQDNAITTAKIAAGAVIPADLSTGSPSWTEAGLLQFNSGYGSVATAYGCRAWVNFNGTGTVAIRASGNVTSITDGGVGIYTVNFTNAMPDANYATNISIGTGTPGVGDTVGFTRMYQGTTTAQQVGTVNTASTAFVDYDRVYVSVFR
jgi:hypothetical protein